MTRLRIVITAIGKALIYVGFGLFHFLIFAVGKALIYFGFGLGCILIFASCYLLNDFADQNIQVYEDAYGSFVVFVICGYLFFWGAILALPCGIYMAVCLWGSRKKKIVLGE